MKKVYSDTGPFAIIPKWVLQSNISPTAIRLYCQLALMADREDGTSYPSRKYLADKCHCTVRSIANAINELADCGALMVEQRTKAGGLDTNKYTVLRQMPGNAIGGVRIAQPRQREAPTPEEPDDLVNQNGSNQSPVSSENSENSLPSPLPVAAFKEAVTSFLAADKSNRVNRLVRIGDSLGYERNGGFAAALVRDFHDKLPNMKIVDAMVSGITAKGDPWAYVRKALDAEARRAAQWKQREGPRPPEGTGGGLVIVSEEEVRAAEAARAAEASRPKQGTGF